MSEHVMVLGKGINKSSSGGQPYESAWLGRWTQLGNDQSNGESNSSKELIRPEEKKNHGVEVVPFPMFKVSQKRETATKNEDVGSSSKAMVNRMPWMYTQGENFPIQEKTTQNLLELIRPVRIYATVDSVKLPEEDGHHRLSKGSTTVSMKLKGKIFGGYLDLFPNIDHNHNKGGAKLESLESSKDTEEDGPRKKNESSAETDTLDMDRLQMMRLSGSNSSSSTKGKRIEIPDMNEEPPLVPDRENSLDGRQGETSNSATQSMNGEHFLARECKRVRLEPELEPSSRWVKRLKTITVDSSDETMKIKEASSVQKGNNNLFLEILKSGINNLQPRNEEPDIANSTQGGENITLLHPWIQRWCKNKSTSTDQPEEGKEVGFEQENQKEMEKRHFPSIGAMALMGKALTGLNPHGLRKTDSLMVWNAQDLR